MHELAITKGIIDIVNSEAEKSGFKNVLEITLRVGEYSGIVPQCLMEFFPIAAAGSVAEGAELVIEPVKARFRCLECGHEGEADRKSACCPECRSTAIKMTSGREFFVESLKVE